MGRLAEVALKVDPKAIAEVSIPDLMEMVNRFQQAGLQNWPKATIEVPNPKPITPGVGEKTKAMFRDFMERLLRHKSLLREDQSHTVRVDIQKGSHFARKIYFIDGFPIELIEKNVNGQMERLLRGDRVLTAQQEKFVENIKAEVSFLREYFGLKFTVEENADKKSQWIRLGNLRTLKIIN